ncbi:3',5'-cyclic-nucleotide phosphodiesterase [Tulasnella sp. 403]|nr:3',5'-cyclic-nucleotide phosphodiesterase [Tulasnella sp. 403]
MVTRRRTIFGDSSWTTRGIGVCPEGLVDAVDSFADSVSVQPTLLPLPPSRPLVVLVPIMNVVLHPPSSGPSDSTPSAVCFPASAVDTFPAISPLDRALAHLRRVKRELEDLAEDLSQIVLMAYSTTNALSGNVAAAAAEQGAKGVLTPPFTPAAIAESFASALKVSPEEISTTVLTSRGRESSESAGGNSTFSSLAQYTLPTQPITLRIPTIPTRPTRLASPAVPSRSLSSGSYDYQPTPLQPTSVLTRALSAVSNPAPSTDSKTSSPVRSPPDTGVSINVQVHSKVDAVEGSAPAAELSPRPGPSVTTQPQLQEPPIRLQTAMPSASEPSDVGSTPKPASRPSFLPPALSFTEPSPASASEQKSLPPLLPPAVPISGPQTSLPSTQALMATSSSTFAVTIKPSNSDEPIRYSDPIAEYFSGVRRRSVDTGGLALALKACQDDGMSALFGPAFGKGVAFGSFGAGWGWGGWDDADLCEGPLYAELLSDMYVHTQNTTDIASIEAPCASSSATRRTELILQLSRWNFQPHQLSPDELLECACILFEALFRVKGMQEDSRTTYDQLLPFLSAVRSIYHSQNKYHNFQHAIDVFQAVYSFLVQAECVPPVTVLLEDAGMTSGSPDLTMPLRSGAATSTRSRPQAYVEGQGGKKMWDRKAKKPGRMQRILGNRDLLALCFAAIGHDVGHPGLSNAFMKNARTPLSIVYDDKSALEQMHCALLLQLMRKHGLGHLIATPTESAPSGHHRQSGEFRRLLVQTVLITDMSLHFDWMGKMGQLAKDLERDPEAALSREDVKLLVCQALIKCGDISNPTRPHAVSEHWSSALLEEWACQAMLERELGLPVSVVASADEIVQAKGQVGFIDMFTKPLFDTTASVLPALEVIAHQGDINRTLWQERLDRAVEKAAASTTDTKTAAPPRSLSSSPELHYRSVFPLSLPPSYFSPFPTPSTGKGSRNSGWPTATPKARSPGEPEEESHTPTMPTSAPPVQREARAHGSVSSTSSAVPSPSPFSSSTHDDATSSTAASSPASHSRSILSDPAFPISAAAETQTTPMRAAYNANNMRRKKSFYRTSWDPQRGLRGSEALPPLPSSPGSRS